MSSIDHYLYFVHATLPLKNGVIRTSKCSLARSMGRFRKHNATSNRDVNVIIDRGGLSRTCCLRRHWRENGVTGPQKQGVALRTPENNSSRCEGQALATSRLTGSRAQALPKHVTSRFGVALCFLNLPSSELSRSHGKRRGLSLMVLPDSAWVRASSWWNGLVDWACAWEVGDRFRRAKQREVFQSLDGK